MSEPSDAEPAIAMMVDGTDTSSCLGYPMNYFNTTTGKGPVDDKDAEAWWPYRHARPINGGFDIPPNGPNMMAEVLVVRDDLRHFVASELLHGFCENCKFHNVRMPGTNQFPMLQKDLKQIIKSWSSNTHIFQRLIYMIFHQFHKDRKWLSHVVDKFLASNNMFLIPYTAIGTKKVYADYRGGFGVVARRAKAQTIRMYMNFLYKSQVWMIATTLSSQKNRDYNFVRGADFDPEMKTEKKRNAILYYVVTPSTDEGILAAARSNTNGKKGELLDFFNLDLVTIMNEIVAMQIETGSAILPPLDLKSIIIKNYKMKNKIMKNLESAVVSIAVSTEDATTAKDSTTTNENKDVDGDTLVLGVENVSVNANANDGNKTDVSI